MRRHPTRALVLGLALAATARADEPNRPTAPASETNPAVPAAGHSVHGEAFNEGPRQKAYLKEGQGQVDFAVSTSRKEARAFLNQGVAQLHTFYYLEAERSFRQAAQIDPDCPMAYWGMAMANVNNPKRARAFFAVAGKRAAGAKITRREQLYLDAMGALYRGPREDNQAYLGGLETIVQDFPDDLDARTWMAMVAWQVGKFGSRQAVDIVLESVERVAPMHPGVHHYRIHLWDGVKPVRAEKSAALYARAAPGIAHAWHMPGHTYTGLKRYADAAYQQEGSARVDHAAMSRDRIMPFEIHNYAHNNQWLATSLSHVGRARDAIVVARDLVEQPRDPQKNGKNDGGSAQRSGRARWSEVLVRYELWDDLIAATTSGALDWSDVPQEKKERAYTLGVAYAARGDRARLAEQVAALRAAAPPPQGQPPESVPEVAELEGDLKLLDGQAGPASELLARATRMRPEARARAHLAARNFGLAESAARKAVEDHPNEVPPLAAQVEVLHAVGKDREAREAYAKLVPLARHADRDTPAFRRLDALVASWKGSGWTPPSPSAESDEAAQNRIDLHPLGPLTWSPDAAEPIAAPDSAGRPWSLAERRGKNVIVLFFLGGQCAHCMQQLQLFGRERDAFSKLDTEIVAISTDDVDATRALKANAEGLAFPMPILPDPKLALFRAYRAFDDFENRPLHGTFLIDARGAVRFQRISADPFLDVEFLKAETARVRKLVR